MQLTWQILHVGLLAVGEFFFPLRLSASWKHLSQKLVLLSRTLTQLPWQVLQTGRVKMGEA